MDLRVADRTVWIISPLPEVARALATIALEEGARVALFTPAAQSVVRPLRLKFDLRALACAPGAIDTCLRPIRSASRWGGAPFGLIIHVSGDAPLAAHQAEVQALCNELAPDGAILILRDADAPGLEEAELARILQADLDVAGTFVQGQTRVSVVGLLGATPDSGPNFAWPRLVDRAVGALAIFLIGRGGPQLTLIGREGLIYAIPAMPA